ncbi:MULTISPECIES: Gfo/Idh/MocA family protein [Spirosoma]|uniref:Gfo/Idh/MocA family oxidoreductase n=1 Tax=Spirosoma liriopis TaxID=2937440 RepID=A0ABT0HEX5_9BACT|nr:MULTISPECIES: Gfo/Idh/MocA family oxidoreductase [Spirosoma]MCK8490704.1 Gfo/Idh/MocA family oxidoreductase [Spirosoma liriopis]UHG93703.1 Gfo/Idh/MocA family oxidoreductase [Spirosoma oryzicola]
MGMVGGGLDAFIGAVHRRAAGFDNEIELVCGVFSASAEKSKATGHALYLPEDRVYTSFEEMIEREKTLPEGERMDFVSIVTPNHLHFPPAKMALENGFHVICDKPMTLNLEEAKELKEIVEKSGLVFGLTHNYTGYPMVKEARDMVRNGKLGQIRKVVVEYPQGWLSKKEEDNNYKQAIWRTDPTKSGAAGCMGDIGTHAENLAEYVTGLKISELCADLSAFVPGRQLDDDGNVLLRFDNGAKGVLHASQIANGEENSLKLFVYGELGGLEWHQMDPNTLKYKTQEGQRIIRTNVGDLSASAKAHWRLPAGHPEGFFEAFANIYRNFAYAVKAHMEGRPADPVYDFPSVADGVRGLAFIDTVIASSKSDEKWTKFVQ